MARRRRGLPLESVQDPGKDLFAYLFLLMMVFSFMLLMTMEEKNKGTPAQKAPDQQSNSSRAPKAFVSETEIGLLAKRNGQVVLVFGDQAYDLSSGAEKLFTDKRISTQDIDGHEVHLLYLREGGKDKLMLGEYFTATQALSGQGVRVVFVE